MKFQDLVVAEASVENIRVLKQLTGAIWSSISPVAEGTIREGYLSQLSGFNRIYDVYKEHKQFAKPFQIMETTKIKLVNDSSYEDPYYKKSKSVWGYHSGADNLLLIWINNIQNQTSSLETAARSTLAHELRHLFQYALYPRYFDSRQAFQKPYKQQQIEIDAVWSQLLSADIDVEDYRDQPTEFVQTVMQRLQAYKQLSDPEVQHYARKTIKYHRQFFDENTETEWRRLITIQGKEITQNADYSVDNFVGDVIQALDDYVQPKIKDPRVKQQVLNYYSGETRKEYKRLSAGVRYQRRKKTIIDQLIPTWEKLTNRYAGQWMDPTVGVLRLSVAIVTDLDPQIRAAAGSNPDLYKELSVWFLRLTRQRIETSRNSYKQQTAASTGQP
jgi:hypothetical protein